MPLLNTLDRPVSQPSLIISSGHSLVWFSMALATNLWLVPWCALGPIIHPWGINNKHKHKKYIISTYKQ